MEAFVTEMDGKQNFVTDPLCSDGMYLVIPGAWVSERYPTALKRLGGFLDFYSYDDIYAAMAKYGLRVRQSRSSDFMYIEKLYANGRIDTYPVYVGHYPEGKPLAILSGILHVLNLYENHI